VVVAEVATQDLEDPGRRQRALDEVVAAIMEAVGQEHEAEVSAIALIQAHSIPKTSSGKIPRKLIRAAFLNGELSIKRLWEAAPTASATHYLAPRTPTEQKLGEIWKEVLGLERVGVHDNFLALGGQSLLATQVVARLRSVFGVELPAQTLFEASTIADLTKVVEGMMAPSRMETIEL
jgi:acyl carrier protein